MNLEANYKKLIESINSLVPNESYPEALKRSDLERLKTIKPDNHHG